MWAENQHLVLQNCDTLKNVGEKVAENVLKNPKNFTDFKVHCSVKTEMALDIADFF